MFIRCGFFLCFQFELEKLVFLCGFVFILRKMKYYLVVI